MTTKYPKTPKAVMEKITMDGGAYEAFKQSIRNAALDEAANTIIEMEDLYIGSSDTHDMAKREAYGIAGQAILALKNKTEG